MPRKKSQTAPDTDSQAESIVEPQLEQKAESKTKSRRAGAVKTSAAQPRESAEAREIPADAKSRRRASKAAKSDPPTEEPMPEKPARGRRKQASSADGAEVIVSFRGRKSSTKAGPKKGTDSTEVAKTTAAAGEPVVKFRSRKGAAEESPAVEKPKGGRRKKADDDLPVPIWRPIQRTAEGDKVAGRKSRRRRGRESEEQEAPVSAAAIEEAAPARRGRRAKAVEPSVEAVPEKPAGPPPPPPKPLIPIPEDAPQVVVRDGVPMLVRNKRVYPPISFFGSAPDERRARTVLEEIRLASENGIHLHVHLVELEVDPAAVQNAVSFAGYMLRKSIEIDAESQVLFRVVIVAPSGWQEEHPNAAFRDENGRLADPSLCDDGFWSVAKDCLQSFVRSLRLLDEKDHIMGLHLERGEWFFADGAGYDTSKAAGEKFREWARSRYLNDVVALRAAWFDGEADFDNLTIPPYSDPMKIGEKFIRSSRKERRWVDYHLFLSDSTVGRIGDLAYAAKEASEGWFLIGVSYGYTFEWSHPSSGHLSLGKLLRTPEVDFIAGPPSYRDREPGGSAAFPSPIDSYAINGKLYISEEDFKTAIGEWKEPDDFNPVIRTPQALDSVHWRGVGAALAHASGVSWMDLWGNGWLKTSTIWDRGAQARSALTLRLGTPLSDPDVAVFIDERALAYLVDQQSFAVLVQNVRESVLRAGVSAGFYLLSDLTHREQFPESKVYIFLNAWDIRPDLRAAIKTRLQCGGKLLFWLYGAGMFDSGRESLERAREVTGVALKPQPFHSRAGTTILNRKHPLCEAFPEKGHIGGTKLGTTYFAIPEEAVVLGEYSQTGLPSFVIREFNPGDRELNWKSVFMGEPVVTPALVRALCMQAGAHVWNFQDDVVHVRPPFLTVHCAGTGPRAITLPERWSAYSLNSRDWVASDSSSLRFNALDGSTHNFLVGRQSDLEAILSAKPDDVLQISEIPKFDENTVRFDALSFDVGIMKLGEWMEGGTLDDVSEDWLLHPNIADMEVEEEEPPEDAQRVGRRRRPRKRPVNGGRERGRRGDVATIEAPDEDLSMQVVFRKRD
jgi:hypothetical protein